MIKGYLKNKLNEAGKRMQDQMEQQMRNSYKQENSNHSSSSNTRKDQGMPKTFDAEYKVLKDDK